MSQVVWLRLWNIFEVFGCLIPYCGKYLNLFHRLNQACRVFYLLSETYTNIVTDEVHELNRPYKKNTALQ